MKVVRGRPSRLNFIDPQTELFLRNQFDDDGILPLLFRCHGGSQRSRAHVGASRAGGIEAFHPRAIRDVQPAPVAGVGQIVRGETDRMCLEMRLTAHGNDADISFHD